MSMNFLFKGQWFDKLYLYTYSFIYSFQSYVAAYTAPQRTSRHFSEVRAKV